MPDQQPVSRSSTAEADEAYSSCESVLENQDREDGSYEPGSDDDEDVGKNEPPKCSDELEIKTNVTIKRRKRAVTDAEKQERLDERIKRRKTELCADLRKKNEKLRKLRDQLDICKSELRDTQRDHGQTERKLKDSEASRTRMTDEIFKQVERSREFFDNDEQVTQEFAKLFESVNTWAKKHAVSREHVDKSRLEAIVKYLCREDYCSSFASDRMKTAMKNGLVLPSVIIAAAINQLIVVDIFEDPYRFLAQRTDSEQNVSTIKWLISVARKKGSEVEEAKAQVFFMKLLSLAPGENVAESARTHYEAMAELKGAYALKLGKAFFKVIIVLLKQVSEPADSTREQSLVKIMRNAVDLSCRLVSQHSKVDLRFLGQMNHERYKVNHDKFECHRACKPDGVPLSRSSIYGKGFDMVVKPMILRTGDAESRNSGEDDPRILAKAVVWIVE